MVFFTKEVFFKIKEILVKVYIKSKFTNLIFITINYIWTLFIIKKCWYNTFFLLISKSVEPCENKIKWLSHLHILNFLFHFTSFSFIRFIFCKFPHSFKSCFTCSYNFFRWKKFRIIIENFIWFCLNLFIFILNIHKIILKFFNFMHSNSCFFNIIIFNRSIVLMYIFCKKIISFFKSHFINFAFRNKCKRNHYFIRKMIISMKNISCFIFHHFLIIFHFLHHITNNRIWIWTVRCIFNTVFSYFRYRSINYLLYFCFCFYTFHFILLLSNIKE